MAKLAIIPARGGSKRIPRKNVKDFLGKPVIAYSIEAALSSGMFDEVMVSTEDDEIAKIAQTYGAKVPFLRSSKNADDFATTAEVLNEVIDEYKSRGVNFEFVCCIYPTAPLLQVKNLISSYRTLVSKKYSTVLSVVEYGYSIWRSLNIENEQVKLNWNEHKNTRSQDLPKAYHDAGMFYWIKVKDFLISKSLFTDNLGSVILDEHEVQDIDTEIDWKLAELKYRLLLNET